MAANSTSLICRIFGFRICRGCISRLFLLGLIVTLVPRGLGAQADNSQAANSSGFENNQMGVSQSQTSMTADAIINLLQQKPSLLRAGKIHMAQLLEVDPDTLNDQMLFDRIREDAVLRQKITEELKKRGFDTSSSEDAQPAYGTQLQNQVPYGDQGVIVSPAQPAQQIPFGNQIQAGPQAQSMGQNIPSPQGIPSVTNSQATTVPQLTTGAQPILPSPVPAAFPPVVAPQAQPTPTQTETPQPELQQKTVPYSNLPSLQDLYTQMLAPDANLKRFGSDVFVLGTGNTDILPTDLPTGPDYVLGPGDALAINIWGTQTLTLNEAIDRQGQIGLTDAGTLTIGGLNIEQGQEAIRKALKTLYKEVHVEISLGRVHTVRVYVVGDVQRPGAYDISSLSTPVNALFAAGGPTSRGSLRVLRQYRGEKLVQNIDLYDFLLRGVFVDRPASSRRHDPRPPGWPEIAVTGMVHRPAIYE